MTIRVHWRVLRPEDDDGWRERNVLYAYITGDQDEILYIWKAEGSTVRHRWNANDKLEGFWADLEAKRGIRSHITLLGELEVSRQDRDLPSVLSYVESVLIHEEEPWGNIQHQASREVWPSTTIQCTGCWPGERREYAD